MANETKWTKGPWLLDADHTLGPEFEIYGGTRLVALVRSENDAALISAAPELNEALAVAALVIHAGHDVMFADCVDCVCVANRQALAKARGEGR